MPLSPAHDALLDWYFAGGAAQCLGGSSSYGAMIERASLYKVDDARKVRKEDITAFPLKTPRKDPSWSPDEAKLSRLGHAARELRRVQQRDPFALEILATLFSDEAARWGRTRWGRVASLIVLTPTGKALLKKARSKQRGSLLKISEAQLAENLVQGPTVDFTRSVQLAKAMREAEGLAEYAARVWNGTDVEARCEAAE